MSFSWVEGLTDSGMWMCCFYFVDDDTARYLCDRLPRSWVEDRRIGEDDIRAALLATSGMIEERVRHALGVLHQERGLR